MTNYTGGSGNDHLNVGGRDDDIPGDDRADMINAIDAGDVLQSWVTR